MSTSRPSVVAIGVFDGVHRGHQSLINQARAHAMREQADVIVLSFDPHPAQVLKPDAFVGLLTTPKRRSELLLASGADHVEFIPFTSETIALSPDKFIEEFVVAERSVTTVVVGENFTFGFKAQGTTDTLRTLGDKYGFAVDVVALAGDAEAWSSTRVRQLLVAGDISQATQILTREHRLSGEVVHGDHRGREIGFPTANLAVAPGLLIPADGVYAAHASWPGGSAVAAVSIGTNPTFDDVFERRVEAYLLDQSGIDLYGVELSLDFIAFIRPMVAFSNLDELISAINDDVEKVRISYSHWVSGKS